MKFTVEDIKHNTQMKLWYLESLHELVDNLTKDPEKKSRKEDLSCKPCWYRESIAGQAFSKYKCQICAKEDMWHNTATPKLCKACAEKHELCRYCGSDRELRLRRKNYAEEILK